MNEYLAAGRSTRYAIRTFIVWLIKNKEIRRLEMLRCYAATKPLIIQQQASTSSGIASIPRHRPWDSGSLP